MKQGDAVEKELRRSRCRKPPEKKREPWNDRSSTRKGAGSSPRRHDQHADHPECRQADDHGQRSTEPCGHGKIEGLDAEKNAIRWAGDATEKEIEPKRDQARLESATMARTERVAFVVKGDDACAECLHGEMPSTEEIERRQEEPKPPRP